MVDGFWEKSGFEEFFIFFTWASILFVGLASMSHTYLIILFLILQYVYFSLEFIQNE